eukprot:CAMPEP_0172379668 /NCGR_PEP_ID=MMETSP1060-20121228/70048_1 /TAXON_ID=37318 /ORGANISM="Pseudo-nitzschia pungens, Strain cf. cingulata" /LENGTH=385 /DNA_ID=CAMNT_0013107413 /DNA_START=220 /DNA_END=1376 /DNA_ORIENTATION=+
MPSNDDILPPQQSKIQDAFALLRSNPKQIFLLDGGTGEELFRRGVPDDRKIWSAMALVRPQYHDVLEDVHTAFLQSGSNAVTTNSYGVVPVAGFTEQEILECVDKSGKIARCAVQKHFDHSSSSTYVLGSLGPLNGSYRPDMIMPHDEGVKGYRGACQALAPHVDAFLAETMSCVEESLQVLEAVASVPDDVESTFEQQGRCLLISYSLDSKGNFRDGEDIRDGMRRILEQSKSRREGVQLLAILFNCAGPEEITIALEKIHGAEERAFNYLQFFSIAAGPEEITIALEKIHRDAELKKMLNRDGSDGILLGAYAHKLTEIDPNWTMTESEAPQPFRNDLSENKYWEEFVKVWIDSLGVKLVGGCCGITPEHISYIRAELDKRGQ